VAAEHQCRIYFILDPGEGIQNLRTTVECVHFPSVGIVAIDFKKCGPNGGLETDTSPAR
jgi:hypothetical protein